jgi:hypothetical protein
MDSLGIGIHGLGCKKILRKGRHMLSLFDPYFSSSVET